MLAPSEKRTDRPTLSFPRRVTAKPISAFVHLFDRVGALPFLFLIAIGLFSIDQPRFLTLNNLVNVGVQSSYLVIVALAQTLVIITAGFDLSVGATIALTSIVTALSMIASGLPPWFGIACGAVAALAVGFVVGAINGVFVALTRISPLIVTLGMLTAVQGVALLISSGMSIYGMPPAYGRIFALGHVLGIPVPIAAAIFVLVVVHTLLFHARAGRYIYAIGSNIRAARVSGISVRFYLWLAYSLAGLLTGFAGFLLTARVGSGEPSLGTNLPLMSIAAAVLGGVSLRGGQGTALGPALGAVFIVMVTNGMDLNGIGSYTQLVILGAVLVFAALIDMLHVSERV
ncbi:MAG: ABC transporter permease [Stellaceae bacterium]